MMNFKLKDGTELIVKLSKYSDNGRLAVSLVENDGICTPYGHLSVNTDAVLDRGEFAVKTWSENEEIAEAALGTGFFTDTGKRVACGFAEAPIWKLRPTVGALQQIISQ